MKQIEEIAHQVVNLSLEKQLSFFFQVGQKMKPFYVAFSEKENFDNQKVIEEILNSFQSPTNLKNTEIYLEKLQEIAPDLDEFPSDLEASQALDVCAFFAEILEYIEDKNQDRILTILELALRPIETELEEKLNLNPNLSIAETDEILQQQPAIKQQIEFLNNVVLG